MTGVSEYMHTRYDWGMQIVVTHRWLISLGQFVQATNDVTWLMRLDHDKINVSDAHSPRYTMNERCAKAKTNAQSTTNVDEAKCTSHDQCRRSMTNVTWPMSFSIVWHFLPKVQYGFSDGAYPYTTSLSPSRCAYILMHACLGW